MACTLEQLTRLRRHGELLGLRLSQTEIEMELSSFPCCGGTGLDFNEPRRPAKKCDVRHRFNAASAFYQRTRTTFIEAFDVEKFSMQPIIENDDEMAFNRWERGELAAHQCKVGGDTVERLVGIGLLASWVHGYRVMTYCLNKEKFEGRIVPPHAWAGSSEKNLVIIWGISSIWDQEVLNFWEQVLEHSLRHNFRVLMTLDFAQVPVPLKAGRARMPMQFQNSLKKMGNSSGPSWLGNRSRSLLREHFLDQYDKVAELLGAGV